MPISWFDKPKNLSGNLSVRLASDCHIINDLITTFLGLINQMVATLVCGVAIALYFEWRTALVTIALLPIMIIIGEF